MRSVDRGAQPLSADGLPIAFAQYQEAAPHLKERLGRYCSFCERRIATNLAVEHKLPKHEEAHPQLKLEWTNFLLGCSNCNSAKGTQVALPHEVLWPDTDPTHAAFDYTPSGRITVNEQLEAAAATRALRLLAMVGLDRGPLTSPADHRWIDRLEIWSLAKQSLRNLQETNTPNMRRCILATAVANGGFSIWMKVFEGDPAMRTGLVESFPGTVLRAWPDQLSDD
jgi:uncharacterized protein (TIGR02646 family)